MHKERDEIKLNTFTFIYKKMSEIWETTFAEKQEMWGMEASKSAILTCNFFIEKSIKDILIPGIGYGRNAQVFIKSKINVTGIEISKTAIELAKKHYGSEMTIYHGSVSNMPFDGKEYTGIFCHALIHLLNSADRAKFIKNCHNQLAKNGYMVFTAISKAAETYGQGKPAGKDRFEIFDGIKMFFYDRESIYAEFDKYGLLEIEEFAEKFPFYLIKCKK
jgi:SAM-dependent methyltransferase